MRRLTHPGMLLWRLGESYEEALLMTLDILKAICSQGDDFSLSAIDVGSADRISNLAPELRRFVDLVLMDPYDNTPAEEQEVYRSCKVVGSALSNQSGEQDFYVTRRGQCSSLLRPNRRVLDDFLDSARFDIVETRRLKTITLQELSASLGVSFDLIKLDIQGMSYPVLKEATEVLANATAVAVEIEYLELYEDQALAHETFALLGELGFQPADIRPIFWLRSNTLHAGQSRGQPVFADGLWIRPPPTKPVADTRVATFLCVFFGLLDWAEIYAARDTRYGEAMTAAIKSSPSRHQHWGVGSEDGLAII